MQFLVKALVAAALLLPQLAEAQVDKMNFPERQAVIINNADTYIQLRGFNFKNTFDRSTTRLVTDLAWKNVSNKPITAFEVVILRYDPFNRPIAGGGTWMITGHNSGDWTPLQAGQSSEDGLLGYDTVPVLTAVAYVRAIRFQDGSVWTCDLKGVEKDIRAKLPVLKDLGDVNPPANKTSK
jgi:hypothetical protein